MKQIALPLAFLAVVFLSSLRASGQTSTQDSLILVDLYNTTNGPNWLNHTNWLSSAPLWTWFGVETADSVHVYTLSLNNNNLTGPIPASIGNLTSSSIALLFENNRLTGSIPSSLVNLQSQNLNSFNFAHNQLNGSLPNFTDQVNQPTPSILDISS
jgi:hypothetical protein